MKNWTCPAEEVREVIRDEMRSRGYINIRINTPENTGIVDRESIRSGHIVNGWTATVYGSLHGDRIKKTATVHYDYAVRNVRYIQIG